MSYGKVHNPREGHMDLHDQRILLTGGSGFLGSAVADSLLFRGCTAQEPQPGTGQLLAGRAPCKKLRPGPAKFQPGGKRPPATYIPVSQHYTGVRGNACQAVLADT